MNHFKRAKKNAKGFTLMELLVVVSIMVILAGLTLGVMSYVNQKQAMEQAKIQLGLLELALEDYNSEKGEYPANTRSTGTRGSDEIHRALFPMEDDDAKVYLTELDPLNDSQGWLSGSGNDWQILDPWGEEYRYRTNTATRINAVNPGFDLWSCGPDGTTRVSRGQYDPEHEDNLDDIRLW
ncbi:prepilin-type N-terminal cleavage/methylation domain-containing protein [Haloferula sp.]|uniref:prepilin-type N-terminal cleavage/methylation domain-containing protein n=1 Tax=Haloferula sp. TaxID=2497595 RepID=UPI0032A0C7ED